MGSNNFDAIHHFKGLAREPNGLYDISKVTINNDDIPSSSPNYINDNMTFKDLMRIFGLTGNEVGDVEAYKKVKQWLDEHDGYVPGKLTNEWLKNNKSKKSKYVMNTDDIKNMMKNHLQSVLAKNKAGYSNESQIINKLKEKYPNIYTELSKGV